MLIPIGERIALQPQIQVEKVRQWSQQKSESWCNFVGASKFNQACEGTNTYENGLKVTKVSEFNEKVKYIKYEPYRDVIKYKLLRK